MADTEPFCVILTNQVLTHLNHEVHIELNEYVKRAAKIAPPASQSLALRRTQLIEFYEASRCGARSI